MARIHASLSAHRDVRILELVAEGYTHQQIADSLGIERSTVTKRLSRLGRLAAEKRGELKDQLLITQVHQLEYIISQSLTGWRKSKEPLQKVTRTELVALATRKPKQERDGEEGETEEQGPSRENISTSVEVRAGNVAYLETALAAMDRQRRLFGLDAPFKVAPTSPDGTSPYAEVPTEELKQRIVDLLQNVFEPDQILNMFEPPLLTDQVDEL